MEAQTKRHIYLIDLYRTQEKDNIVQENNEVADIKRRRIQWTVSKHMRKLGSNQKETCSYLALL